MSLGSFRVIRINVSWTFCEKSAKNQFYDTVFMKVDFTHTRGFGSVRKIDSRTLYHKIKFDTRVRSDFWTRVS